jgi:LuxR family maltose regulon positive regulatory protein
VSTPLLQTKLYIPPPRPDLVPRPHLIERLNDGLDRKLTLISAPAGFGKTTLLSEWAYSVRAVREPPLQVAWLSLDESDNDPTRFLVYFVAALQTIETGFGEAALTALQSPQPLPTEEALIALINEIAAIPGRIVLVLDDYHLIEAQQIHKALTFLLAHQPPQMHVVIVTRADPPLPIALFRGRGQMTELRQADLRFTSGEAAEFVERVAGLKLAADDIAALTARTEGWIAGLQMAAVSMRGRDAERIPGFVAAFTGSHATIADYLSDQVLGQQSEDVRDFLLHTSILDHMTGPLCDAVRFGPANAPSSSGGAAVAGQGGGGQRLEELQRANLFVVSLDDERRWFRYHHLFASLLRRRLEQTQPAVVPELHRRASMWYERNGLLVEAVKHALQAGDLERVERLVAHRVLTMIYHGELATLAGWLEALPSRFVRSRPWLCVAYAWVMAYSGRAGDIDVVLEDAERGLEDVHEAAERRHIAGHIAVIRAYLSIMGRKASHAAALARESLDHLPEEDLMARSFATQVAAIALRMRGDLLAASETMAAAITLAQAAGADYIAVDASCDLARLQMARGHLREAAAICQEALRFAGGSPGRREWPLPIAGYVMAHISLVLHERNDLQAALRHARDSIELCRRWGEKNYLCFAYVVLAKTLLSMGETASALDAIRQARQVTPDPAPLATVLMAIQETRIRLAQGDRGAARGWAETSGLSADDALEFNRYQEVLTLVQVHIACGELDDALTLLTRLLEMVEATGAMGQAIKVLVLRAIVLQAQGQVDPALSALSRALSLAEPEGYVRAFVEEGAAVADVLRLAISRGTATRYAHDLLAALEEETRGGEPIPGPSAELIEPLSEREMEVLRLLITHLSRKEIADQLCVSPNTVRFHLKNIYTKLGVHSRSDAVQRAEELDLL